MIDCALVRACFISFKSRSYLQEKMGKFQHKANTNARAKETAQVLPVFDHGVLLLLTSFAIAIEPDYACMPGTVVEHKINTLPDPCHNQNATIPCLKRCPHFTQPEVKNPDLGKVSRKCKGGKGLGRGTGIRTLTGNSLMKAQFCNFFVICRRNFCLL